ncbi:hypothetical protein ACFQZX_00310 [Mucilaginibacter litoreus]|uniref:Lipoprotein n=1 Tax=Mucilaginibacter litoreus TaxID=1048221 RepID=A0ABW3AM15_9SPHI
MKNLCGSIWVLGLGGLSLLLTGCGGRGEQVAAFIPGKYVHASAGAYSRAEDTLIITLVGAQNYRIERRAGFQPLRNGQLLPKRFKVEVLSGDYDPKKQVLFETTKGRVFAFDVQKGLLLVNKAVYRKL